MEPDFSHTLAGGREGLSALLDALEAQLIARGAPMAAVSSVMVAADEALSNVLDHGGASPAVEVTARVRGGEVTVEIEDGGPAFDPTAAPEPDTSLPLEAREAGGLGIHLVRKLMDEVAYERRGGRNRLRFSKSFAPRSGPHASES